MLIDINNFSGMMPKINEQKLPLGAASSAWNFKTNVGSLVPYRDIGESIIPAQPCRTFTVWPQTGSTDWQPGVAENYIIWSVVVDYCQSVSSGLDRIIYTGDQYPKIADPTILPLEPLKLGIFNPLTPPVALDGYNSWSVSPREDGVHGLSYTHLFNATPHNFEPDATEDIGCPVTSVSYCYTVVDNIGQESAPSPPSQVYDVSAFKAGQGIRVSLPNVNRPTNNYIEKKRVYRCTAGTDGAADFMFIGEVSGGVESFDDYDPSTKTLRNAAEVIQTIGWDAPPLDLSGITTLSGGVLAGFIKGTNEVCFSEPLVQYAWPEKYRLKMPQPVLCISSLGEELVVFTGSNIITIRGEPGYMSVSEVFGSRGTPCLTGRGVVKYEKGLLYPGHDGLYLYDGSGCFNITKDTVSPETWKWYRPDRMIGAYYDEQYWIFEEDIQSCAAININNGVLMKIKAMEKTELTTGAHVDYRGRLFVMSWYRVFQWEGGQSLKTATWTSGVLPMPYHANLSAAIITAETPYTEGDSIQLKVWGHHKGVKSLVFDSAAIGVLIRQNEPFRLPGGFVMTAMQIEIQTNIPVSSVKLATSMTELSGAAE